MEKTGIGKYRSDIVKWVICIVLPLIVMLIPTGGGFTSELRTFVAITILLVALIATSVIPMPAVALLIPVAYIIILKVPAASAFGGWLQSVPWMVFCGFIVSYALEKTGLIRRIAYRCILLFGGNFTGIVVGMMLVGTIVSLLISDVTAKAVLLGSLALGMVKALKLKMGGKTASGIGLAALVAMLNPGFFVQHGSTNNLVPMGIVESLGIRTATWAEYFAQMFVPQLIFTVILVLVLILMYKPKESLQTKDHLRSELAAMGKMDKQEIKLACIAILLVIAIVTNSWHGIDIAWLFIIATVLMMFPGIKIIDPPDLQKCNLPFTVFVASCLSIGIVSNYLGFGEFLGNLITPLIEGMLYKTFAGTWLFGFITNFILTPLAAYSAFTEPVVRIAQSLGVSVLPLVYTFELSLEQIVFPYEFAPVLLLFGYGMISFKDMVKYNVVKSIICLVCILLVYMTWWKIIGLL